MKCKYCGNELTSTRSEYCCRTCYVRDYYIKNKPAAIKKTCKWCGNEFETVHRGRKYCCDDCRDKAAEEQRKKSKLARGKKYVEKKPISARECAGCGEAFTPTHGSQLYCCDDCRDKKRKERALARGKIKPITDAPKKYEYKYKKYEGLEVEPKPTANLSPASKRWAKMSWTDLTKELLYYKMSYPEAQKLAEGNMLPEDFGLARKKVK